MLWLIPFSILSFFVWAAIHELAHALTARICLRAHDFKFKLYPHTTPAGNFLFASVSWVQPMSAHSALVSLAPWAPDLLGCALFPFTSPVDFSFWWSVLLACLAGGAVVDLAVGSFGISPDSDLRVGARLAKVNANALRIAGFIAAAASVAFFISRYF